MKRYFLDGRSWTYLVIPCLNKTIMQSLTVLFLLYHVLWNPCKDEGGEENVQDTRINEEAQHKGHRASRVSVGVCQEQLHLTRLLSGALARAERLARSAHSRDLEGILRRLRWLRWIYRMSDSCVYYSCV
uniref:Uncharacterized protein n=1 Tax=Steinernema glaseri TaxID=37863 RepID=A0A1I7ZJI5_9BILA